MYNIHSHYENIFAYLKTIYQEPVLLHLHPFGATDPEHLELMHCNGSGHDPVFLCYDQEPLIKNFNDKLFEYIREQWGTGRLIILLNTEKNSNLKSEYLRKYNFKDCYYFFHAFAAADWYRGYRYCTDLIEPTQRKIQKKYITFNRLTGGARMYRSVFIAELARLGLLQHGHVSYNETCPENGHYSEFLKDENYVYQYNPNYLDEVKSILDGINFPLRIDTEQTTSIPNGSQTLSAILECMESFLHVVTETCFFDRKLHLTEKIFKPIVAKQPFVLLGCANNLQYLKSYGFKTFSGWWDENYDVIEDPQTRLQVVVNIINDICQRSDSELELMLKEMQSVLDHNYNHFYSNEFLDQVWSELKFNINNVFFRPQLPTSLRT
jgi:hypothetical protein